MFSSAKDQAVGHPGSFANIRRLPNFSGSTVCSDAQHGVQDQEPEVRVVAAETVCKFCEAAALPPDLMQAHILAPLKALSADSSQHVRAALATSALQLSPRCGNNESGAILELILTLLKDRVRSSARTVANQRACTTGAPLASGIVRGVAIRAPLERTLSWVRQQPSGASRASLSPGCSTSRLPMSVTSHHVIQLAGVEHRRPVLHMLVSTPLGEH